MSRTMVIKTSSAWGKTHSLKRVFSSSWAATLPFMSTGAYQKTGPARSHIQVPYTGFHAPRIATSFDMLVASDIGGSAYSYVD